MKSTLAVPFNTIICLGLDISNPLTLLYFILHALQTSNILHHLLIMFLVYHLSYPTCPPRLECPLPKGKTLF